MGSRPFQDHFSSVADRYERFRPSYPEELYAYLARAAGSEGLVWEVGAGSGQATRGLAGVFRRVVATDGSEAQLRTLAVPRVRRVVCLAERAPLRGASVDLVVVAQALHWLDFEAFFAEVRRVTRPGGTLAVWSYRLPELGADLDTLLWEFAHERMGPFWPADRAHVEAGYRTISFPFSERPSRTFTAELELDVNDFLGYVSTWSAVGRGRASLPQDPMIRFTHDWRRAWGDRPTRTVRWPILLRSFEVR